MSLNTNEQTKKQFHFKDPASAISHLIFTIMIVLAAPSLLLRSLHGDHGIEYPISITLFLLGLLLLYSASTIYHSFDINNEVNVRLKKMDHMMIYVLIAGSYSPICLIGLHNRTGYLLFGVIWALAFLGLMQAIFFIHAPKWLNSVIYIVMGWLCVFALPQIAGAVSRAALCWLFAGGIIYTIGGVIYALKVPLFNSRHKNFNSHDIFHLFCIGGSVCHYILMYCLM